MGRRSAWSLVAVLVGCDAPADGCEDGAASVGTLCFPAQAAVRVGYGFAPAGMVTADLDGDGALDVAAASPTSQTVTIAWGPAREVATSWAIGEEIAGLALGDVDGDGRLDLATALPASDAVAVLYGRGGRDFLKSGEKVAVGAAPRAVIVVDLDRDGRGELVTADVGDHSLSVVRGGERARVVVGVGPHALAAGDVDGDGDMDVAVTLADSAEVQVLLGDGRGGLLAGERMRVGAGPLAIVAGDFNGDGRDELATADALDDTVSVIDGSLVRVWPVPARPRGLAAMRDGGIAVLSEGTSEVARLDPRTGALATTLAEGSGLAAGDVDGDGREDLVVGTAGATMAVRRGTADGLEMDEAWRVEAWLGGLAPIDVDGDGRDELLVDSATLLGLLLVSGSDGQVVGEQIAVPGMDQDERTLLAADVDVDGRTDIVVVGTSDREAAALSLLQQDEGGFVAAGEPATLAAAYRGHAVLGDVDGDGGIDVVMPVRDADGPGLWLLRGDGAGGWVGELSVVPFVEPSVMVPADLDGDGRLDVVLVEDKGTTLWTLRNVGEGGDGGLFPVEATMPWRDLVVAGLGGGDVTAVLCGRDGVVLVRGLAGGLDNPETVATDSCWRVLARDGDGDGDVDVFAYIYSDTLTGEPGATAVTMLANDGAGGLSLVSRAALPGFFSEFQFAELDGAPGPDVVVTDDLQTTGLYGAIAPVLLADPRVVVGDEVDGVFVDVNGDEVLDRVMVGRGVAVAIATGDGGFAAWQRAPLAGLVDPDVTVVRAQAAGDIDGDGLAEVVVLAEIDNVLPLRAVSVVRVGADGVEGETVARLASTAAAVFVADLDRDGADEIVVVDDLEDAARVTLLRAGDGFAARMQMVPMENRGPATFAIYDVHGDGRLDLMIYQSIVGGALSVARGQGDGSFGAVSVWNIFDEPYRYWMRDVNGDRGADLLVVQEHPGSDTSELLLVPGGTDGRAAGPPRRLTYYVDTLAFGDLDGDGVSELVTGYAGEEDAAPRLTIGRASGDGSYVFRAHALPESGPGPLRELVVDDWDGDGRPDIAVVDASGMILMRQRP